MFTYFIAAGTHSHGATRVRLEPDHRAADAAIARIEEANRREQPGPGVAVDGPVGVSGAVGPVGGALEESVLIRGGGPVPMGAATEITREVYSGPSDDGVEIRGGGPVDVGVTRTDYTGPVDDSVLIAGGVRPAGVEVRRETYIEPSRGGREVVIEGGLGPVPRGIGGEVIDERVLVGGTGPEAIGSVGVTGDGYLGLGPDGVDLLPAGPSGIGRVAYEETQSLGGAAVDGIGLPDGRASGMIYDGPGSVSTLGRGELFDGSPAAPELFNIRRGIDKGIGGSAAVLDTVSGPGDRFDRGPLVGGSSSLRGDIRSGLERGDLYPLDIGRIGRDIGGITVGGRSAAEGSGKRTAPTTLPHILTSS